MTDVPRKWWEMWAAEVDLDRKKALEVAILIRSLDCYRFKPVDDEEEFLRSTAYRVGMALCLKPGLLPHVSKALQKIDCDRNEKNVKIYRAYRKALRALPMPVGKVELNELLLGPTLAAVKREYYRGGGVEKDYSLRRSLARLELRVRPGKRGRPVAKKSAQTSR